MKIIFLSILFLLVSCAQLPSRPVQFVEVSSEREDIRKAVRPYFSLLRDCYAVEYEKNPAVQGDMTFTWEIHAEGFAKNIAVVPTSGSLKNEALEHCLTNVISRVRFPAPAAYTVLIVKEYFFRFKGNENKTYIEGTY